jgi:2',3'-cyclic-nucleotide 2'-phosphodiesterase (5'-nucleotidase family)
MRQGSDLVLVDGGNFSAYRERLGVGLMKSELLARFMEWIGYEAVNIGEREVGFGLSYLRYLRQTLGPRLVSGNVRAQDGSELASPWIVVDRGDVRVGVTGVVGTDFLKWTVVESLSVGEPAEVLPGLVAEMRRACDVVVVLACTRAAAARELAALTGAEVVISRAGMLDEADDSEGPPWILQAGRKGEKIGVAVLEQRREGFALTDDRKVVLDESVRSDSLAQRMIDQFKAQAKAARTSESARPSVDSPRYLGQSACAKCHSEVARRWLQTGHASAMETLVGRNRQSDTACIPCHVTGHGEPGGFRDMGTTPWLGGVQCEACHGPGSLHVTSGGALPYGSVSALDCVRCHTVTQSPDFSYQRGDMDGIH